MRSRRTCSFPQKHIFVLNDQGTHKTIYRKRPARPEAAQAGTDPERSNESVQKEPVYPKTNEMSVEIVTRPFGTLTALKQQLLAGACAGGPTFSTEHYYGRPGTLSASAFADSAYALSSAPLACYSSWLGRRERNPYLVQASQRLYVHGLKEVQEAVNDPKTALRDETFSACLSLIVYEALECPDRSQRGYDMHVDGCSRLVQLRGASLHQEGASHATFCAFRFIGVSVTRDRSEVRDLIFARVGDARTTRAKLYADN